MLTLLINFLIIVFIPWVSVYLLESNPQNKTSAEKNSMQVNVFMHDENKTVSMNLEEYIKGVVTAEMPASFELEALKAQAVAARTYTITKINANKNSEAEQKHNGADICTDFSHCQAYTAKEKAYQNWQSEADENYKKISKAVDETACEIITFDNEPIRAVFHSTSVGKTQSSKDVWGSDIHYLKSVDSIGDDQSPKFKSQVTVTQDEFKNKLAAQNPNVDFSKEFIGKSTLGDGGCVSTISLGGQIFKGTVIRTLFSLRSAVFTISQNGGNVIFDVTGNGHGVGMSQYGANYLAKEGKSYLDILKTYYTDVSIEKID